MMIRNPNNLRLHTDTIELYWALDYLFSSALFTDVIPEADSYVVNYSIGEKSQRIFPITFARASAVHKRASVIKMCFWTDDFIANAPGSKKGINTYNLDEALQIIYNLCDNFSNPIDVNRFILKETLIEALTVGPTSKEYLNSFQRDNFDANQLVDEYVTGDFSLESSMRFIRHGYFYDEVKDLLDAPEEWVLEIIKGHEFVSKGAA